jgi:hypothetical protein
MQFSPGIQNLQSELLHLFYKKVIDIQNEMVRASHDDILEAHQMSYCLTALVTAWLRACCFESQAGPSEACPGGRETPEVASNSQG